MTLVAMVAIDEDALICDMAETYRIYSYESLPVRLYATLAAGLRQDSRIRAKMLGVKSHLNMEYLLAFLCDNVTLIRYSLMKDPPKVCEFFVDSMIKEPEAKTERVFESGEDFQREWARLTKG